MSRRDNIEQAIARGLKIEAICIELAVAPEAVQAVWSAMDAAVAEDAPTGGGRVAACGTRSGFARHWRLGEQPCASCKEANRLYQADRMRKARAARKKPAPRPSAPCGTDAAYKRHRKRGERACDPCRAAHTEAVRRQTMKRRAA